MNGQIQYGSVRTLTLDTTRVVRRQPLRLADPDRFDSARGRSMTVLIAGALALGGLLVAVPREVPGVVLAVTLGGVWLALVLSLTLPSSAERAGAELSRRLGQFRHAMNALGDTPTRAQIETVLGLAGRLELREDEIRQDLSQLRASLDAITLQEQLARGQMPMARSHTSLAPGDVCHFAAPVRFGRRKSDGYGHLTMTSGWLKFRGTIDISVAWSEVAAVQRADRDVIVLLQESPRSLRFCCEDLETSARAGVLADHLARASRVDDEDHTVGPSLYQAAV